MSDKVYNDLVQRTLKLRDKIEGEMLEVVVAARKEERDRVLPLTTALRTISVNIKNPSLTDAQFREFVGNTLRGIV